LKTNPWERMPAEIASRFEATLGHLHSQVAAQSLMRYVLQSDTEMDASELLSAVGAIAVKLIKTTLESVAPALTSVDDADLSDTHHGLLSESATRSIASSNEQSTTIDPDKAKPLSVYESALAKARPAMLACGGRQRLILLVGSEAERVKLEHEVRNVHTGGLTVAVIPGTTPMLIHEAQQIKMDNVIDRLSMMAAGSHQVTQRLHSRSDIEWSSPQKR
jgi:hypothetical protein